MAEQKPKEIIIAKCTPISDEIIPDITLRLAGSIPEFSYAMGALDTMDAYYWDQARLIAGALMGTLPQGTMHRLCQELLSRYSSVYVGPMVRRDDEGKLH